MSSCLLLIDVQESFRHRPYWQAQALPAWLAAQNALIDTCEAHGTPIVRIFHVDEPATAENPFACESGHVRPLDGLAPCHPAATFHKSCHSALVDTGLGVWLVRQGIRRLIVSGIRTEQCCETTTRHASDLGWSVDFVSEATLTFDMQHADGSVFAATEIRRRTETVLRDRFARIRTVGQVADDLATGR